MFVLEQLFELFCCRPYLLGHTSNIRLVKCVCVFEREYKICHNFSWFLLFPTHLGAAKISEALAAQDLCHWLWTLSSRSLS